MAYTTGTSTFNLDLNDLIEEAYERAGIEVRTGYEFRTARRSLNLLTIEWANRGINLWTIQEGAIAMVTGQAVYPIPDDTIDLLDHVIRQNNGTASTQTDINITRISESTYSTIPNKLANGRPIQVWVNRQTAQTNATSITLASTITSTATTIPLNSVSGLTTTGFIKIDSETIGYTNISGNSLINCTRGQNGTTATAHTGNTTNATAVSTGILQAAVSAQPGLALFGTTTVGGRSLGDITGDSSITSADALAYTSWAAGANSNTSQVAWIEGTLNPYILANPTTYAAYITLGAAIYVQNLPCINVWPTPNAGGDYTFIYWRLRRLQDAGNGVNVEDIPFRLIPCLVAGLAFYIASKRADAVPERVLFLKQEYEQQWLLASQEDREKASDRFVPRQLFY
jgi:hypothetical protein